MEPFYLIVLGIATVFFILVLTGVGLMMRKQNQSTTFPPNANTCPDGWTITDGSCNIPTSGNLGTLTKSSVSGSLYNNNMPLNSSRLTSNKTNFIFDPNDIAWASGGKTQLCAQKSWASSNNIAWDGVSNYNSC